MRKVFVLSVVLILFAHVVVGLIWPPVWWSMLVLGPLLLIGIRDYTQPSQSVRRNFPIIGHFRYILESIRPEINQYFIESDTSGVPFNREQRSVVYQRAKGALDTVPFGTKLNVYDVGYEWVHHSLRPRHVDPDSLRVVIGGPDCTQPYSASILNISAMSFGSMSHTAVLALNDGARMGGFAHNTGEGGVSPYHLRPGGDLIWQIGTGYFGCRNRDGSFSAEEFARRAVHPTIKMIELKLSQGAKPGHGGILPAAKVTREIAEIRLVEMGRDVLSPPAHSAFETPIEMMRFIGELRRLSGGKPVGFKMCVGERRELAALCKAMVKTGITPDYISIDGGEGGTGAAPLEFSNHIGRPLIEGLIDAQNVLVGFGLRERVRLLCAGKVTTGFDVVKRMALGADACSAARSMMLALGCIQALRCNTNHCPTGVATQNPQLAAGLVPGNKAPRVARYHREVIKSVAEIVGAMGIAHPSELRPRHLMRRTAATEVKSYAEIFEFVARGSMLDDARPGSAYASAVRASSPESFEEVLV